MESFGSPLQYCHKLSAAPNSYHYIPLSYASALQHEDLLHYLPVCYLFRLYSQ